MSSLTDRGMVLNAISEAPEEGRIAVLKLRNKLAALVEKNGARGLLAFTWLGLQLQAAADLEEIAAAKGRPS